MYEGVIHGVLQQAQPWSPNNSPSSSCVINKNNNMITSVDLTGSCECVDNNIGSHNIDAEDFFIGDLSDFSNEDIGAPIKNAISLVDGHSYNSLQPCDDNTSASNSKPPSHALNSDSTATADHTSTSGSVLLHDSPTALDYNSSLHIEMDSSLSLPRETPRTCLGEHGQGQGTAGPRGIPALPQITRPSQCQAETGFEWLTSFGEDNLIYGASNFGMDSFLLSNAEPFDGYDGLMKHGGYEDDSNAKGNAMSKVGLTINDAATNDVQGVPCSGDHFRWHNENGVKEFDAMMLMPHSTGSRSARTKRARSAGWSSSNILCNNWANDSPTNSLNSTSQIMTNHPYSSPTFLRKQEEKDEQHGYIATQHNVELIASSLSAPNRDKPFRKMSEFCSNDQPLHGWAKEEENIREESVSNYGGLQPRRCTHCLSQKTPQWRAGPHGPKTLCNACGVRYKSGRLFDEYRPAKSPTFLSYKHSNSHKKVMEMRRRKTLQYNNHHHHHQATHQARAVAPHSFKHAQVDPHQLGNKLKIKLHASALEPHSRFSDVTLISTRTAIESPASFLY